MEIFKLQDHLKNAASLSDICGIYWSSRDVDPLPVGNHHFITFVYESKEQADRMAAKGFIENFSEENDQGLTVYFTTMGVDKDKKTKGIVIKSSPKSDRKSIKEIAKEENTSAFSYDRDFQGHRVPCNLASPAFSSNEELMEAILERVNNFNAHFNAGDRISYSLIDENCACIVNSIFKVLGYPDGIRHELGEFWGVDWGEEDLVPDRYFEEMIYTANSNTKEIHLPACEWISHINEENKVYFSTIEEAINQGYNGCHYCLDEYDTD